MKGKGFWQRKGNRKPLRALFSFAFLCLFGLGALLSPLVSPYDPNEVNLDMVQRPPNLHHLFGTDHEGRDIFSRVIYGARASYAIAIMATLLSIFLGGLIGLGAGYAGGKIDLILLSLMDITLAFPSLLLAIGITVVLTPSLYTVFIALGLVGWANFARLARSVVLSLKERPFFEAARAMGCPHWRLIMSHLLPNSLPVLLVVTCLNLGGFILSEASLSFLGLGPQPPTPSWGAMVSMSRQFLHTSPWMSLFPGLAIAITIISFNILADSLRDFFDIKGI